MKKNISAFLDKYRAAIFTAMMLCFVFVGQAQTYQQMFRYGVEENRTDARVLLAIPADTFAVPSSKQYKIHFAGKNDTVWKWSPMQLRWVLFQTGGPTSCRNQLITDWSVSWQGTGFKFSVHGGLSDGTGSYQIGCNFYTEDSTTVTLDASDDDKERIDVIYLDETGIHVLKGDTAAVGSALKPTLNADQLELSFVTISPGTTTPTLTQLIVYNENTESTVTNVGTTTDPNNATNVYIGVKSVNVTNVNDPAGGANIDAIYFDKSPALSSWAVLGFDGLSLAIKLKVGMAAGANIGVQLGLTGGAQIGTEVILPLVKTNTTTYQQITIPLSAFGNLTNTNITRVRFRYIRPGSTATYTGFYLDYIYFVDGVVQSSSSGSVTSVGIDFVGNAYGESAPVTSAGVLTLTPLGSSGQYVNGLGNLVTFPTIPNKIGLIGDRTPNTNRGMTIDADSIFLDSVSATNWGVASPSLYNKIFQVTQLYYISNAESNIGDSLVFQKNDSTTGVKLLVPGTGVTLTDTDSTIVIAASGGSAFLPLTGTGTATGNITGDLSGNTVGITHGGNDFFKIDPTAGGEQTRIQAYNTTGGDNVGYAAVLTSNTDASFNLTADFSGGTKSASIVGLANTSAGTLTYSGTNILNDVSTVSDSTGVDVLVRDRSTGEEKRIRADQLVGSGSRFGVSGEDDTGITGVNRTYTFNDDESTFEIKGENPPAFTSEWVKIPSTSILDIGSTDGSFTRGMLFTQGLTVFYGLTNPSASTYKILVVDSVNNQTSWVSQSLIGGSSYTDKQAQDAVGAMVDGTLIYTDSTPLLSRAALTGAITASAGSNTTALGSFTTAQLNTALSDNDVATGGGTATGTNTGDQTITLTGNVTGSGTGSFAATIANSAVTLAKQADVATSTVFYRKTAGTGAPEVNTLATLKTDLGLTGTNSGDQTSVTGNAGTATALATGRTISISGDLTYTSPSFDGSGNVTAAGTLATVNSNVGSFGSATQSLSVTANAKGLITAISAQTVTPAVGSITGLGTGVATWLATPSSANLLAAITDETGTGLSVFNNSPTFLDDITVGTAGTSTGSILIKGTTSGTATLTVGAAAGTPTITLGTVTGTVAITGDKLSAFASTTSAELAGVLSDETGTGKAVLATSPTFTTSALWAGATSGNITIASDALSNVANGTNLSGTGHIPFVQSIIVRSDETLANSASDQNLFGSAHDVITVQANTTYQFYITGDFTHGAVAHTIALGFTPTTATVTSIEYNTREWVTAVGTATASGVHARIKSTATTVINISAANATESFEGWGTITIGNTGGTITPQIKFSSDPTGTILLKTGSRMNIWPVGNDTFSIQGNIN